MTVAQRISTERLLLRRPEAGDFPTYRAYCASDRSRFVRGPYSEAEAFDKFAAIIGHWILRGFGRYAITLDGRAIGHVGPTAPVADAPPEMTWTLWDGTQEGKGYATEAALAVTDHLLGACNWPELTIRILPDNHGSLRIAERLGARVTDDPAPDWYPGSLTFRLRDPAPA